MTKATLASVLSAAKTRLGTLEADLVRAEELTGSVQLRMGMVLSSVKDALSQAGGKVTFKDWTAKNSKRSYTTLNRWANTGTVALIIGMTDDSETVPPLYKVEPGYRFIKDARTPERYTEGSDAIRKWWDKVGEKDLAAIVKEADRVKPRKDKDESSGGRNNPTGDNSDASETVTFDPAAVSVIRGDVKRQNGRAAYRGVAHEVLNQVRVETALYLREHPNFEEYLAAFSTS